MYGVCFQREHKPSLQDQWSFVFSHFGVEEIWERGWEPGDGKIYQPVESIDTCAELPDDRPLVVLAPPLGRYIQGTESLLEFTHPKDAIYVFGGSHTNLTEEDMGGRVAEHYVYIPTADRNEMYAYVAAAVVLWDRVVKGG